MHPLDGRVRRSLTELSSKVVQAKDLMHARLDVFDAGTRHPDIADDPIGGKLIEIADLPRIEFDVDRRRELASYRRNTFQLKMPLKRGFGLLEAGQILRREVAAHQQLLRSKLFFKLRYRAQDVYDQTTRFRRIQLCQTRHSVR